MPPKPRLRRRPADPRVSARVAAFRQHHGYVKVSVDVPKSSAPLVRKFAKKLRTAAKASSNSNVPEDQVGFELAEWSKSSFTYKNYTAEIERLLFLSPSQRSEVLRTYGDEYANHKYVWRVRHNGYLFAGGLSASEIQAKAVAESVVLANATRQFSQKQ